MGFYLTYVLVPEANVDCSEETRQLEETYPDWFKAAFGASLDDPNFEGFPRFNTALTGTKLKRLLRSREMTIEAQVAILLEPYCVELRVGEYRRECDCLVINTLDTMKTLPKWRVKGRIPEFTKEEFSRKGFELKWWRKLQQLGTPDEDCEECQGFGIVWSNANPGGHWDFWDIGSGHTEGILRDCVKGEPENLSIVPVRDLDLDRIPTPDHVVTPDGDWLSSELFIWSGRAVVVDEQWEETVRAVLRENTEATLVVVNSHY